MTKLVDELLSVSSAISRGEVPSYQHSECVTIGAFDLLLVNAHDADAFSLLQSVCARYDSVRTTGESLTGYFDLIYQLARQSGTTEIPDGLDTMIAQHPHLSAQLRQWYRLER